MAILCGKFDVLDASIRSQFIGASVSYDVVHCRMVSVASIIIIMYN